MGVFKLFLIIHVGCTLFIMEAYCEGTLLFTSMSDLNVRVKIQQTVDWNNTSFYPSIHMIFKIQREESLSLTPTCSLRTVGVM